MKPLSFLLRNLLLVSILLSCVQPSSNQTSKNNIQTSDNQTTKNNKNTKFLKFKKYTYVDQQGTGLKAFSFLMPSDWEFKGGMRWILDNPSMPSVTAFKVYDPKGKAQFEVFPNHSYCWTTNQQFFNMFPPGSRYFGNTVMQPVSAQIALRKIILPEQRAGVAAKNVLKDENLPELAKALKAGEQAQGYGNSWAQGAKMRINYRKDDVEMEEEFYAVVEAYSFPIQSMYGTFYNTIWYIDYIFSFKAEKGKLESYTNIFKTITASFKLNPQWYAKYSNVIEYLAQQQIKQIKSVGEFSRMLSQMSDQISDEKMQQFESRGKIYDKISQKSSDNILGIDRYYDPHEEKQVELPSGYNHAWSNNNGEYIMTDDPNFNPNESSNLHWESMKRE
jgi:hypothetical protein